MSRFSRTVPVLIAVAVASALSWLAWLGWETGYRELPDGSVEGPYSTVQVIACAVTVAAVVVAGCLALRGSRGGAAAVIVTATSAFAVMWARDASSDDASGLWVVGLVLLVLGMTAGLSVVAFLTLLVRRRLLRNRTRTRM
ncbi:hypothetical protein [Rhodococcus sp. (in: high G+C Gram-positive bacteria)]|uniref:hypothetical protein n=1 Tax=Rhodococcus sp. TaxID=1831 RepID=UPI00388DF857